MNNMMNNNVGELPQKDILPIIFDIRDVKKITILVKHGTTVADMIKQFFNEIQKPELI